MSVNHWSSNTKSTISKLSNNNIIKVVLSIVSLLLVILLVLVLVIPYIYVRTGLIE